MRVVAALLLALTLSAPAYAGPALEAEHARRRLRALVWPFGVPEGAPDHRSGSKLVFRLGNKLRSHVRIYPGKRNTLVIFHQGHQELEHSQHVIAHFTRRGYPVAALEMLLYGQNRIPGEPWMNQHEDLAFLPDLVGRMMTPIKLTLDHLGFDQAIMVGLSGGGWATHLYAALDPRIVESYAFAGSLPHDLRAPRNRGDTEQRWPGLNYRALYWLASTGARRHVQALNTTDPCCFRADPTTAAAVLEYEAQINARRGGEGFSVWFYEDPEHRIPPAQLERIR